MAAHHVFLIPGMFGFGKLAGYDYFGHVEDALAERFEEAGLRYVIEVIPTPPTASIRRRAITVAEAIHRSAVASDGPIHIIGHSTGGLDARLISSPTCRLRMPDERAKFESWQDRLASVVSINTPHYGTPLAGFFATVSGTRLLYALSLLTVTTLSVGGPPLTVFSTLVAAIAGIDEVIGVDAKLLDKTTNLMLRFLGDRGRDEVREWLDGIRQDQGGIIQITPEGMDLFNAAAENSEGVRYGSIATYSPAPAPMRFVSNLRSPYAALSGTIYSTLYAIASRVPSNYPYPTPGPDALGALHRAAPKGDMLELADGVVPTLSMLWGDTIWIGRADHLDIVGHFEDSVETSPHTDWLNSGAEFRRVNFCEAMDSLAAYLLNEEAS